jgi:crossover junction endodeoxyribonuclease RuvC
MRILGVDPALSITGYGVIDYHKNNYSIVDAGVIITSAKQNLPQRLDKIFKSVEELIAVNKPEVMVLEKVFVHYHHPTTAFLLGQARGIICLACAKANIPLIELAATQVKKAVIGTGQASKEQVARMVANILNLKAAPKYTDVTDALALAICYSHMVR